jgi:HSP20 family protein
MNMREMIPWGRSERQTPARYSDNEQNPFLSLHREMNRLFDDVVRSIDAPFSGIAPSGGWPKIEISDD